MIRRLLLVLSLLAVALVGCSEKPHVAEIRAFKKVCNEHLSTLLGLGGRKHSDFDVGKMVDELESPAKTLDTWSQPLREKASAVIVKAKGYQAVRGGLDKQRKLLDQYALETDFSKREALKREMEALDQQSSDVQPASAQDLIKAVSEFLTATRDIKIE